MRDVDVRGLRRRIKDTAHDLRDHGFDKVSRKQMLYNSRDWSQKSRNPHTTFHVQRRAIRNPQPGVESEDGEDVGGMRGGDD